MNLLVIVMAQLFFVYWFWVRDHLALKTKDSRRGLIGICRQPLVHSSLMSYGLAYIIGWQVGSC